MTNLDTKILKKMNKFIVFKVGIILTAIVFFTSCKKEESMIEKQDATNYAEQFNGEKIVLGKKLENPYTVENMKRAYAELKKEYAEKDGGDSLDEINIYTTNLYVRFLPNNIDEYNILADDTTLEIFDFPLDYEIEEGGTYYHDPALPADQITWQYCAPKVECELPEIESEVIEELYLPQEDTTLNRIEKNGKNIADLLEMKALQITGNLTDDEYKSYFEKSSWEPSGSIKVTDDFLGIVPIVDVAIQIRRFFSYDVTSTDTKGNFKFYSNWSGPVNYMIKWEQRYFDIRNGLLVQAYYNGPKQESRWDLVINSGDSWRYSHIFRASYMYYNRTDIREGLSKPAIRTTGIKIAYAGSGKGTRLGDSNPRTQNFALQSIRIWGSNDNGWFRVLFLLQLYMNLLTQLTGLLWGLVNIKKLMTG